MKWPSKERFCLQRILLPTKNFGFGKLLSEVCRCKYFYFFFYMINARICIYLHICTVCQRPSFTYSKLWYLRYLTFWPEHHWEERKLKVSARHLTNIISPSNNEPGRAHFCPPCSNETHLWLSNHCQSEIVFRYKVQGDSQTGTSHVSYLSRPYFR